MARILHGKFRQHAIKNRRDPQKSLLRHGIRGCRPPANLKIVGADADIWFAQTAVLVRKRRPRLIDQCDPARSVQKRDMRR